MNVQTILNELKKEGWFFEEDFIKNNEDMLQAIADKTLALQLQQTGVKQSVCKNCGKPFVMHSRASGMCPDRFKHFE